MNTLTNSPNIGARIAALLAGLGLAACQNPDSFQAPSEPSSAEGLAPRITEAKGVREAAVTKTGAVQAAGVDEVPVPTPCTIDFNNADAMARIPDQAFRALTSPPFYQHPCNGGSFTAAVGPLFDVYRLEPEISNWCAGSVPKIGTRSGTSCINQTQGKYWARRAGNTRGFTGMEVYVPDGTGRRNFDLKSVYVHSGTVEIEGWSPVIGKWVTQPLTAGTTWTWSFMSTQYLKIFSHGRNGLFQIDDLKIAVY